MEVLDAVVEIVRSVGFPIAIAIYMIYLNNKQAESHLAETKEMAASINELRVTLQSLVEKMEVMLK